MQTSIEPNATDHQRFAIVADDDPMTRMLLVEAIVGLGLGAIEAGDGIEAVERVVYAPGEVVVILLDLDMPRMDGLSACAAIRGRPGGEQPSIILLTGVDDQTAVAQSFRAGASDFLPKPIQWPLLTERLRLILNSRALRAEARQNKQRLTEAQRLAKLGSWECRVASGELTCSDEIYRIFGITSALCALSYRGFLERVHQDDRVRVALAIGQTLAAGTAFTIEHRIVRPNGDVRFVLTHGVAVEGGMAGSALIRGTVQDITERRLSEQRMHRLAHYDDLTRLPKRDTLIRRTSSLLTDATASNTQVGMILIGIDRFGRINDSLGYVAGDRLLTTIAGRLAVVVEKLVAGESRGINPLEHCALARAGGDRFLFVVDGLIHAEQAGAIARRILDELTEPVDLGSAPVRLTGSAGVAVYPSDATDAPGLLQCADVALEHAKQLGGDDLSYFSPEMNRRAARRLQIELGLPRAMETRELELHFQPQMRMSDNRIVGMEALLRWTREGEHLSPDEFIPVAEETGLIIGIGNWVLEQVCVNIARWRDQGRVLVPVAVNLSARQFEQLNLAEIIRNVLRTHRLDPRWLEIELTETVIMRDPERVEGLLNELKAIGVRLAIDDFGTGYSSLSYLRRFPLDTMKIDREFIKEVDTNPVDEGIVKAVLALGRSLDLTTVAEGVESEGQRAVLERLGCDICQGFLFSKPEPAYRVVELLALGRSETRHQR